MSLYLNEKQNNNNEVVEEKDESNNNTEKNNFNKDNNIINELGVDNIIHSNISGLHPNTIIFTKLGPKRIIDIQVNDEVITHDGSFQKVSNVIQNQYTGQLTSIKCMHSITTLLINNSEIFSIKGGNETRPLIAQNKLKKGVVEPEMININNLTTKHFVSFPIPVFINDINEYDIQDCYIYGLIVGNGSVCKKEPTISIAINTNKMHLIDYIKNYLNTKNIHFTEDIRNGVHDTSPLSIRLIWRITHFIFNNRNLFYNNNGKIIHPKMLHLPRNKILQIIRGILETDACIQEDEISIEKTSKNVIDSIRYMFLRIGIGTSGYSRDRRNEKGRALPDGRIIKQKKISYILNIQRISIICNLLNNYNIKLSTTLMQAYNNGDIYSRIKEIEKTHYTGPLVHLEIDSIINTNFLTEAGLVSAYNA